MQETQHTDDTAQCRQEEKIDEHLLMIQSHFHALKIVRCELTWLRVKGDSNRSKSGYAIRNELPQ